MFWNPGPPSRRIDGEQYLVLDRWPLPRSARRGLATASRVHVDALRQRNLAWLPAAAPKLEALIITDLAVSNLGDLSLLKDLQELSIFMYRPEPAFKAEALLSLRRLEMRYWEGLHHLLGSPNLAEVMIEKATQSALQGVRNWRNITRLDLRSSRELALEELPQAGEVRTLRLAAVDLTAPLSHEQFPSLQHLELDRVRGWDPAGFFGAAGLRKLMVEESGPIPEAMILSLPALEELVLVGSGYSLSAQTVAALRRRSVTLHVPPAAP